MSKILKNYKALKNNNNNNKLYLFQSGIFYIAIEDDALTLSELFDFKIIDFGKNSIKCGFPTNKISYYSNLLKENNINFEIISSNYSENIDINNHIINYDYIIKDILDINFDEITFKDAFFKLQNIQNEIKSIKNKGM